MLQDSVYEPDFYWEEFYYEKDHQRNDSWIDNNARIGKFHKDVKNSIEYFISVGEPFILW